MPDAPSLNPAARPSPRAAATPAGAPPSTAKPTSEASPAAPSTDGLSAPVKAGPVSLGTPAKATGAASSTGFTPWSSGGAEAGSQTVSLEGRVLEVGQPLTLEGLDPDRPVAYVRVETVDGGRVTVKVGRDAQKDRSDGSSSAWGFQQPTFGPVTLEGRAKLSKATVFYAGREDQGYADYYSIPVGADGLKHGETLTLPIPAHRRGQDISNIDVSFHAPVRKWNQETDREEKPTYARWFSDERAIGRKFVDPNEDAGNTPEIDNVHPANSNDAGVLTRAGKEIRVTAENTHIPADETAMTVQWVRISYRPTDAEVKSFKFKGKALPNHEWEGKWIDPGRTLALDLDPTRRISRVEVQWSDKPDDVGYEAPGKWALGSLLLDGKPLGRQREHVGSPEWQIFDHLRGAKGAKLEIKADACRLKIFEVKVYYET